jgi:hypothetical protein
MCDVSTPMQSQPKYIRLTRLGRAAWSDLSALLCARTEIDSLCLVRSSGGDGLEMCREDRASIWCKLVCPRARALHDLLVTVENCGAENRRCGFTLFIAQTVTERSFSSVVTGNASGICFSGATQNDWAVCGTNMRQVCISADTRRSRGASFISYPIPHVRDSEIDRFDLLLFLVFAALV